MTPKFTIHYNVFYFVSFYKTIAFHEVMGIFIWTDFL